MNVDLHRCIEVESQSMEIGVFKPWDYHLG
jgi:hypothetical protein